MSKPHDGGREPSFDAPVRGSGARESQPAESIDTDMTNLPETQSAGPREATRHAAPLPETIGTYRVLRVLGEGGMGRVYLCEQARPKRQVAVKVMLSRVSPSALRRFEREAEALARLHHVGIAQIFEAGCTIVDGQEQPFIAMELVAGRSIINGQTSNWPIRAKLQLLVKICQAVEHAHQNGVLHRDLKPGNILVGETDDPKILDFGLARALDRPDSALSAHTEAGQIVGTLAYMSPEQASGDPLAVDTRSDVYSLGVVAYQLLSGQLPIPVNRDSLLESLQSIRDRQPVPLGQLHRLCRGDLETIVGKALVKAKEQRYQSVAELRADFERYLQHRPIVARHPSVWQRLQKFVLRHRALTAVSSTAVVAIIASLVVVSWLLYRTQQANATITQQNIDLAASRATERAARRDAVGRLAETYVLSARIAARTGQWREAIELYDHALAMDQPDPVPLQVERVRLLALTGSREQALADIDALEPGASGRQHAAIELLRGELLLSQWGSPVEACKLIQQAIDSGALEKSEDEYARGVVTDNALQAAEHFRATLALNPFHQQARIQLAYMCIFLGRLDEARQEVAVAQLLFPDDETAIALEAGIDLLCGQHEQAVAKVRSLAPKIGQRTADASAEILQQLGVLLQKANEPDSEIGFADLLVAYGNLVRIVVQYRDVFTATQGSDMVFSLPNHPVLRRLMSKRNSVVLALTFHRYQQLADEMLEIADCLPVDAPYALAGACHLEMALRAAQKTPSDEARTHAERASELLSKADQSPSIVAPLKRVAHMRWVDADMMLLELAPQESEAQAARRQQVVANVRRFSSQEPLSIEELAFYAKTAFLLDDRETARGLLVKWQERDAAGLESTRIFAAVEAQSRNFYQAIVLADKVLASRPTDDDMLKLRENASEQLQQQAVAVRDKAAAPSSKP